MFAGAYFVFVCVCDSLSCLLVRISFNARRLILDDAFPFICTRIKRRLRDSCCATKPYGNNLYLAAAAAVAAAFHWALHV